ncbi:MAG: hypothetical protein ACK4Z7_02220 [Novosphingobium sp.]
MNRIAFFAVAVAVPAAPALAGLPIGVPGPEAGVGLGALAALGAGYAWMRKRARRG